MSYNSERENLDRILAAVRKRILINTTVGNLFRFSLWLLPAAALLVGLNQRYGNPFWSYMVAGSVFLVLPIFSLIWARIRLGANLSLALAVDQKARLKDRISSAYEFLDLASLDEPQTLQIHDAIRHAQKVNSRALFQFQYPRFASALPLLGLAFLLSFFVPRFSLPEVEASIGPVKQLQLEELELLEEELAQEDAPEELEQALEKLREIKKRFEEGELSERDLMLELARLDDDLRQRSSELGVENLQGELNVIVPHLMSSAATLEVANALKENQMDKAAEEMKKVGEKMEKNNLTEQEKRELAVNMGVAASKLGSKSQGSFGGDFSKASQALENSDSEKFASACNSIGDKLNLLKKCQAMMAACKKIGNCKAGLGQCYSQVAGFKLGPKITGNKKGGLQAGTAASGNPLGEASRLEDNYRKMLKAVGQAGEGPVESEVEVTEGQMSESTLAAKELHANYQAVAEEAVENENIPLSHRFHVKRYFQSIRPKE